MPLRGSMAHGADPEAAVLQDVGQGGGLLACHILTHPDLTELPRPEFPDQLERLPGDFPFVLGPGVLGSQAHTRLGQPLA